MSKRIERDELIDLINNQIEWLDDNIHSNDIVSIGMVLDKLSILSEGFGEIVSEAYGVMNELEDDYKLAVSEFRKDFKEGVAKGEIEAEVRFANKKKDWTQAKNIYKKLSMKLDRIDKILESHRQSISVMVKTSVKNMSGV
jgi:hypothetical protein